MADDQGKKDITLPLPTIVKVKGVKKPPMEMVKLRDGGQKMRINTADFDPKLHARKRDRVSD